MSANNNIFDMNKQLQSFSESIQTQFDVQTNAISKHLHDIQSLLESLVTKLQISYCNSQVWPNHQQQQQQKVGESVEQLASVMCQYTKHIYKQVESVSKQFDNLKMQKYGVNQFKHCHSLYEIPVELQLDQIAQWRKIEIVQEYFSNIQKVQEIPKSITQQIYSLFGKHHQKFHLIIEPEGKYQNLLADSTSQDQLSSVQLKEPLSMNSSLKTFNNFSFAYSRNFSGIPEDSVSFICNQSPNSLAVKPKNQDQANTPTFHERYLSSLQLDCFDKIKNQQKINVNTNQEQESKYQILKKNVQIRQFQLKEPNQDKKGDSQTQIKFSASTNFQKIKDKSQFIVLLTQSINHSELKNRQNEDYKIIYQIPVEIIPSNEKLNFIQQVYNLKIDSKKDNQNLMLCTNNCEEILKEQKINNVTKQQQELTFSNDHGFTSDLTHKHQNGKRIYELLKGQNPSFSRVQDKNVLEGVRIPKKISLQSFSENQCSGLANPIKSNYFLPHKQAMNWSASIESFIIGSNHKNANQSENNSNNKIRHLRSQKGRMIEEEPSQQEGNSPIYIKFPYQEYQMPQQPKSGKIESLNSLPQLNFCGSSEINDHISQGITISNATTSKNQSLLRSINTQQNDFSLKFKQSCIVGHQKKTQDKCIDPTGSIYDSLAHFSTKVPKMNDEKRKNKVYIIQAQSSSQGSRTQRQMYISQVKRQSENNNKIPSAIHTRKNKSKQSPYFPTKQQQQELKHEHQKQKLSEKNQQFLKQQKIDAEAFYELQEHKTNLQQQKTQMIEQLYKSQTYAEGLKQQLLQKQTVINNMEQSYQQKLQAIIEQISLYQQKLLCLEEQLKQKTEKQNILVEGLHDTNKVLIDINELLEEKANQIMKLQNNIQNLEQCIQQKDQIIRMEILQKKVCIQQIALERENEINMLSVQLNHLKQINIQDTKTIEKQEHQIQQNIHKLQVQKQQYEKTIRIFQEALLSQKQEECIDAYQKQLEKLHIKYSQNIDEQIIVINTLQYENQKMKVLIKSIKQQNSSFEHLVIEKDKQIGELKNSIDLTKGESIKLSDILTQKSILQIEYLRKQLITTYSKLESAQIYIQNLKKKPQSLCQQTYYSSIHLQFCQNSQQLRNQSSKESEQYTNDLESMINQYQHIIIKNYLIIKELQDLVYQYLSDGMQKQQSEEKLSQQVKYYQKQIKALTRQKMIVQFQNKRMKKTIAASEKKISAIGDRLVNAAKNKLRDYSEETSNQTHLNIFLHRHTS